MEVIYSFRDSFVTTISITILINLFPIIVALIVLFVHRKGKQPKQRVGKLVMIVVVLICIVHFYVEVTDVYGAYKSEYERVEGCVEQLTFLGENYQRYDLFVVEGVTFKIYPSANTYSIGYRKPKEDGGAITSNGQKVEIYYFTDGNGDNHIMKLKTNR